MKHLSSRKLILIFLAGWGFLAVGNLINPGAGEILTSGRAFAASDPPADANGVYKQFCLNCHAANGKGDETMKKVMTNMPDFTSDKWQKEVNDAQISVSITDGKGTLMPAFAEKVSSDQVQALVEYIRKFDSSKTK